MYINQKRLAVIGLLIPVLTLLTGARGSAPMHESVPIPVVEGMTAEQVSKALRMALEGRGWTVDGTRLSQGDDPCVIDSTLHVRIHMVKIKVEFDDSAIRIHYVDSANMGYRETRRGKFIHPKYTTWLNNIERDIKSKMLLLQP